MKFPLVITLTVYLFSFAVASGATEPSFTPYRGYLDNIEDDDTPITVFESAGQNWKYCKKTIDPNTKKKICAEAVGWPKRDAVINVLEAPIKVKTKDAVTDAESEEEYSKIEFTYTRKGEDGKIHHQKGTGYIETSYLSKTKTSSFYTAQNKVESKICPPATNDPQSKLKQSVEKLPDLASSIGNLTLEKKADLLSSVVGFCPLKPPTKTPGPFKGKGNVYDQAVLPTLLKAKIPKLTNEENKQMTRDEMIQIDTLARTLYGEMAICYRRGLQYPMAVAKMILNRTENEGRKSEFISPPHSSKAPPLTQVCTTPSQFSMWLKNIGGSKNQTLHHGLCPPTTPNGPYWKSDQASAFEYDIWKNTIRIATEAILYPKKFKARTQQITGYHYTSGLGKFYDMTQVRPSIEGKKIDRSACLEIWKEKEK